MTYYSKIGKMFFLQLIWLLIFVNLFVRDLLSNDYIWFSFFLVVSIIVGVRVIRVLYFKLTKTPMLIVNEVYIFDRFENIKYYWKDIDEIIPTANDFLDIRLFNPRKYLIKITNPFWILVIAAKYKVFKVKTLYEIDMRLLDIKKGENKLFMDRLNNFSVIAQN